MPRIVSLWFPRWPILRLLLAQERCLSRPSVDPERPIILIAEAPGGPRVAALNEAAEEFGLAIGDQVADAWAKTGVLLQVQPVDRLADQAALRRLALWATRYTPAVSFWNEENGADGLFLDVSGAAHLFGGEEGLLVDLSRRLNSFGLPVRLAIADTPGMAWALSHYNASPVAILPSGQEAESLASLPVEALRLSSNTCMTLRRLGFKRIGSLLDKPRAPFAVRFPAELLKRLDQALGRAPEPLTFIAPLPAYHAQRQLLEPVVTQEAIVTVATLLMEDLVPALLRDGVGARVLQLALYRVDGEIVAVDLGLMAPTRSPAHVARLIDLKLERIVDNIDAGFGFEALALSVKVAERVRPKQTELASTRDCDTVEDRAALVDSLRQRLGSQKVRQLRPMPRHLPERAESSTVREGSAITWAMPDMSRLRPILLLPQAEPAEVIAVVPEGHPRHFRWRGVIHRVTWAQGPERIAGQWWRRGMFQPTRDYYLVESETGRRFWLYRQGLYERETADPRWFVHGLFA